MPYKTVASVPKHVPKDKRKQWLEVFNSVYAAQVEKGASVEKAEEAAFRQANGVIKKVKAMEFPKYSLCIPIELKDVEQVKSKTKLLYMGQFNHGLYGEFNITEKDLQHAIDNFNDGVGVSKFDDNGTHALPGNYQHASYDANAEIAKASGWGFGLYLEDNSLFTDVEWTPMAKEFIQNKEFLFISPEFHPNWIDEQGRENGFTIIGFALTNVNFLREGMLPVELMNLIENNGGFEMDNKLKELLKLSDGSDGIKEVRELMQQNATLLEECERLKKDVAKLTKDNETSIGLKDAAITKLTERITTLETSTTKIEITKFVDGLIYDPKTRIGKILPSQKDEWVDLMLTNPNLEGMKKVMLGLPDLMIEETQGDGGNGKEANLNNPGEQVHKAALELQSKDPKLGYELAVEKVLNADKALMRAYTMDKTHAI